MRRRCRRRRLRAERSSAQHSWQPALTQRYCLADQQQLSLTSRYRRSSCTTHGCGDAVVPLDRTPCLALLLELLQVAGVTHGALPLLSYSGLTPFGGLLSSLRHSQHLLCNSAFRLWVRLVVHSYLPVILPSVLLLCLPFFRPCFLPFFLPFFRSRCSTLHLLRITLPPGTSPPRGCHTLHAIPTHGINSTKNFAFKLF